MIDLQSYRLRIGTYQPQSYNTSRKVMSQDSGCKLRPMGAQPHSFDLRFWILLACAFVVLIILICIELNPGPCQPTPFVYRSEDEKTSFLHVKSLELFFVKCASHLSFLQYCRSKGAVPSGLLTALPVSAAKPDSELSKKVDELQHSVSISSMDIIIDHYANRAIPLLIKDISVAKDKLLSLADTARYPFLLTCIETFSSKEKLEQSTKKKKKLQAIFDDITDFRINFSKQNFNSEILWLPNLGLTKLELGYLSSGRDLCDNLAVAGMSLITKRYPHVSFSATGAPLSLLSFSNAPTIHIHHDGAQHFVTTTNLKGDVHLYDSLNKAPTKQLLSQITAIYSPTNHTPTIHQVTMRHKQVGSHDCGLFSIAYAFELAAGNDPNHFKFNQLLMRTHFRQCLEVGEITSFPKFSRDITQTKSKTVDLTRSVDPTEKWTTPKKTAKAKTTPDEKSFVHPNKFQPLAPEQTRKSSISGTTKATKNAQQQQTKTSFANSYSHQNTHNKSNVTNLSSRRLTPDEIEILSKGLSFSPSVHNYDKSKFSDDVFSFIRKLKLTEFFQQRQDQPNTLSEHHANSNEHPDRKMHNWSTSNSQWYPDEVKNDRSPQLLEFIKKFIDNTRQELKRSDSKTFNNLTAHQRSTLKKLQEDTSITIKEADKGGSVVVMDTKKYDAACEQILNDPNFYQVLTADPNPDYFKTLQTIVSDLASKHLISTQEQTHLTKNSRTPTFYGLPKIHKSFNDFPQLRPICSGYNSVTNKLSEWVDGYLFPAVQKLSSHVRDSTDFIKKLQNYKCQVQKTYLVTMDVTNLYPNISHKEGLQAAEHFLEARKHKSAPTSTLTKIINFILQSNTMTHNGKFYHQTKGCAMGTNMAVNYANLFMAFFENKLLKAYEDQYKIRPQVWLRYIDDIFFVWTGDLQQLEHFLNFCNNFAKDNGFESNIQFTSYYSENSVDFLDITISHQNGRLKTELFTKPTAAHLYLHRTSDHPHHTLKAGPKSQFIRIRRICSDMSDYDKHSMEFLKYYTMRGYQPHRLKEIIKEVRSMDREELLTPKAQNNDSLTARVPLVINWNQKFSKLPSLLRNVYSEITAKYPQFSKTLPAPPVVSFRKNKNLKDILCHQRKINLNKSKITEPCTKPEDSKKRGRKCLLCKNTSNSAKITNHQSKISVPAQGGNLRSRMFKMSINLHWVHNKTT